MEISTEDAAYLAGFIDGDGSIVLTVRHREAKNALPFRFKACVVLYQNTKHLGVLEEMRAQIGCGYVSTRADGISELRIEGFGRVGDLLTRLRPYFRFKREQVDLMLRACALMDRPPRRDAGLSRHEILLLAELSDRVSGANYKSNRLHTGALVREWLEENAAEEVVPVTTGSASGATEATKMRPPACRARAGKST